MAPEVAEFEEFVLRTGGDTGGWDPDDHAEFLNILKVSELCFSVLARMHEWPCMTSPRFRAHERVPVPPHRPVGVTTSTL